MVDKTFHIFLLTLFGAGAIVILLMSWLTPTPASERIINTLFAAIGVALAWMMRRFKATS